jgi:hypothetical protein
MGTRTRLTGLIVECCPRSFAPRPCCGFALRGASYKPRSRMGNLLKPAFHLHEEIE